jgi:hypothetical protein
VGKPQKTKQREEHKMKAITTYTVKIGYRNFIFTDLGEACAFAEIAVRASEDENEAEIHIFAEDPEAANVDVS